MNLISKILISDKYISQADENNLKSVAILSWLMSAIGFLFVFIVNPHIFLNHPSVKLTQITLLSGMAICPLLFKVIKNIPFITNLFISLFLLLLTNIILHTGGIESPIILWFPIIPLLASILTKKRNTIIWIAIIVILNVIIFIIDSKGIHFPNLLANKTNLRFIRFRALFTSTMLIGFSSYLLRSKIDKSMQTIVDKKTYIQQLLRIVCHDIATPLTIIHASSKIQTKKLPDEDPSKAKFLRISSATKTIEDILNFVRNMDVVTEGKVKLKLAPTSLDEVIKESKFLLQDKLSNKNIVIKYKPSSILVGVEKVSFTNLVMNNIISNSIKFSNENSVIDINASLENDLVHITISDSGIGMNEKLVQNIFNPLVETNRKGTSGESGSGFGMPIAKEIIDKFDGKIYVESKPRDSHKEHSGTTFHILLKRA